MEALDLSRELPRSPFVEVGGFAWLPRLTDKARAHFAGTRGDYSPYPCPGDKGLLDFFGVDPTPLGEVIKNGASDAEVAAAFERLATKPADAAARAAYRRTLTHAPANPFMRLVVWGFRLSQAKAIRAKNPGLDLSRLDTLAKVLTAEEGQALPA